MDSEHFDLADYMKNFSRETQTRDNNVNKNKLTLADLQAARRKSNKTFLFDKQSDY
ncbi:MAG: hypothetical protein WAM54_07830 [Nitrososphaeraceae archaeon]